MRILVVTTSFPRHADDWAGRFVLDQAKALTARGHSVTVVAPDDAQAARDETLEGIRVRRVRYFAPRSAQVLAYGAGMPENIKRRPWAVAQLPLLLAALRRAAARGEADVILAHWALAGLAAGRPARRRGLGLATTLNGSDLRLALEPGAWQGRVRAALDASAKVLVLGSQMAEDAIRAGLVAAQKVEVVPFGVDDELLARSVGPGEAGRVAFAGRLVADKGVLDLAEAVGRTEGARLVCVGAGPLAGELSHMPRVECLGPLPRERLLAEVARAACVALPSYGEGLPITLLEAMALGRPVVATPVGAVPELMRCAPGRVGKTGVEEPALDERQCGALVEPGDVDALAAALGAVLGDSAIAATLSGRARERIAGAYTWSRAASKLEDTLEAAKRAAAEL